MSSSVFKEQIESDEASENSSNLVIFLTKDGSMSVDQSAYQTFLKDENDSKTSVSIVRISSPTTCEPENQEANTKTVDQAFTKAAISNISRSSNVPDIDVTLEAIFPLEFVKKAAKELSNKKRSNAVLRARDYEFQRYVILNDHCYTPFTSAGGQSQMYRHERMRFLSKTENDSKLKEKTLCNKKIEGDVDDDQFSLNKSDIFNDSNSESESSKSLAGSENDRDSDLDYNVHDNRTIRQKKIVKRLPRFPVKSVPQKNPNKHTPRRDSNKLPDDLDITDENQLKTLTPKYSDRMKMQMQTQTQTKRTNRPFLSKKYMKPTVQQQQQQQQQQHQQQHNANSVADDILRADTAAKRDRMKRPIPPAAHVNALLTDISSLFSTPDIIKKVKSEEKLDFPPPPTHMSSEDNSNAIDEPMFQSEAAKVPQLTTDVDQTAESVSLAKVEPTYLMPPLNENNTSQPMTVMDSASLQSSAPAHLESAMQIDNTIDSNADHLGNSMNNAESELMLPEDLLQRVAELVKNQNLQEIIDKQVLEDQTLQLSSIATNVLEPINNLNNLALPIKSVTPVQSDLVLNSPIRPVSDQSAPILIKKSDGKVIVLPKIEAPATRGAKRRAQSNVSSPSSSSVKMAKTAAAAAAAAASAAASVAASTAAAVAAAAVPPSPIPKTIEKDIYQHKLKIVEAPQNKMKTLQNTSTPNKPDSSVPPSALNESDDNMDSDESWNSEDDPDRLWCICKQPHNNRFMICCDACEDWFHGKCVNITKAMGQQMEEKGIEWSCPNCIKKTKILGGVSQTFSQKFDNPTQIKNQSVVNSATSIKDTESHQYCIVCNKIARPNSIYCCDECILKHAQNALTSTTKLNKTQTTSTSSTSTTPSTGAAAIASSSYGSSAQHAIAEKDTSMSDVKSKTPSTALNKNHTDRVTVFERSTGRCLTGSAAPSVDNLKKWLQENPTYEVISADKVQNKRVDSGSATSKTTNSPSNVDSTPQKSKATTSSRPSKLTLAAFNFEPVKIGGDKKGTPSPGVPQSSPKPTASKTISKPTQKISSSTSETQKTTSAVSIRINVRKTLEEQLSIRMSEPNESSANMSADEIKKFVFETEEQMYLLFNKDTGPKYRAKYRSLIFNIKDRKNLTLFKKICEKHIKPSQLVRLSPEEMASQELAQWREKENKHQLEIIKKSELDLLSCAKNYVLKTHKGEEVIENLVSDRYESKAIIDLPDVLEPTTSAPKHSSASSSTILSNSLSFKSPVYATDIVKREDSPTETHKSKETHHHHKSSRNKDYQKSSVDTSDYKRKKSKSKDKRHDSKDQRSNKDRDRHGSSSSDRRDRKRDSSPRRRSSTKDSEKKPSHSDQKRTSDYDKSTVAESKETETKSNVASVKQSAQKLTATPTAIAPIVVTAIDHKESKDLQTTARALDIATAVPLPEAIPIPVPVPAPIPLPVSASSPIVVDYSPNTIWTGRINMVDVAAFKISAQQLTGESGEIALELPVVLDIVGRIGPETVWDYITKIKKSPNKEIIIIRLTAAENSENVAFTALYSYLDTRNRLGVIKTASTNIKDFYIMPLAAESTMPKILLPSKRSSILEGPNKPNMLLGVIIRIKDKRHLPMPAATTGSSAKKLRKIAMDGTQSSYKETPKEALSSSSGSTGSLKLKLTTGLPKPMKEESSSKSIPLYVPSIDDSPYSPGAGSDNDGDSSLTYENSKDDKYKQNTIDSLKPEDIDRKMEELNRQIEAQKQEIAGILRMERTDTNKNDGSSYKNVGLGSSLQNISIPSNLPEILERIKQNTTFTQQSKIITADTLPTNDQQLFNQMYSPNCYSGITNNDYVPQTVEQIANSMGNDDNRIMSMFPPVVVGNSSVGGGGGGILDSTISTPTTSKYDIDERVVFRGSAASLTPSKLAQLSDAELLKMVPDDIDIDQNVSTTTTGAATSSVTTPFQNIRQEPPPPGLEDEF